MNEVILEHLKSYPAFRERKNKNRWLAGIVLKKYGVEITPKLRDQLADFAGDILNGDRYWRLHTNEYPDLRGTDWETKVAVEQEKQIELGYVPGYDSLVKKLNEIH